MNEFARNSQEQYFDNARATVRAGYRLWALKHQLKNLQDSYEFADQAVSDPRYYALRDSIAVVEREMN